MQNPKFETVTTQKTVQRTPMTDHEYLVWWAEHSSEHRCADLSTAGVDMQNERQGYLVRYRSGTDQEYYSWSPKEIMDAAVLPPLFKIDLDTSRRTAEPNYSPLFEKVHAEFLRQLSVTSLPQALEAALVVYTDGLTYTEE